MLGYCAQNPALDSQPIRQNWSYRYHGDRDDSNSCMWNGFSVVCIGTTLFVFQTKSMLSSIFVCLEDAVESCKQ